MLNEDKELDEILNEADALKQSTALNKIILKLLKDTKAENIRLWLALLIFMLFTLFLFVFVQVKNSEQQDKFIKTQNDYLNYFKEFEFEVVEDYSEIIEDGNQKDMFEIVQENKNGNNIYQNGKNVTYNQ